MGIRDIAPRMFAVRFASVKDSVKDNRYGGVKEFVVC